MSKSYLLQCGSTELESKLAAVVQSLSVIANEELRFGRNVRDFADCGISSSVHGPSRAVSAVSGTRHTRIAVTRRSLPLESGSGPGQGPRFNDSRSTSKWL